MFLEGIFYGVSFVSILEVVLGLFVVFQFSKRTVLEHPASALPSKRRSNVLGTVGSRKETQTVEKVETCDWLNKLLNRLYFDHIGYERIRSLVLREILEDFGSVQGEYASVLEKLEVKHFTLGKTLPVLHRVSLKAFGDLPDNQFVVFDVSYEGGAAMAVKLGSFGKSVRVESDLVEFHGKMVLEAVKWPVPYLQAFFFTPPQMEFALRFPEQRFKWLAQLLSTQLSRFLIKHLVHPNALVHHFSSQGRAWHTEMVLRKSPLGDILNQTGALVMVLEGASDLPDRGDYYLVAEVGRGVYQTKVAEKTKDPTWKEIVSFDLRKGDVHEELLKLTLRKTQPESWSRMVTLPLHSLMSPAAVTETLQLARNPFLVPLLFKFVLLQNYGLADWYFPPLLDRQPKTVAQEMAER